VSAIALAKADGARPVEGKSRLYGARGSDKSDPYKWWTGGYNAKSFPATFTFPKRQKTVCKPPGTARTRQMQQLSVSHPFPPGLSGLRLLWRPAGGGN